MNNMNLRMNGRYAVYLVIGMVLCLFAVSCKEKPIEKMLSDSYVKRMGSIYYKEAGGKLYKITEADGGSFKPLAEDIAEDKNYVYFQQYRQVEVDKPSFRVTPDGALKDKNHVYLRDYNDTLTFRILYHVDLQSYALYKGRSKWAHDKNHVYYNFSEPVNVDGKTFSFVNSVFMKDRNFLYYMTPHDSLIHLKADLSSIVKINDFYIRDNHRVYYINADNFDFISSIPFRDRRSIKLLGDSYLSIDDILYFDGALVNHGKVDIKKFRKIGEVYYSDGRLVFCDGNVLAGVDLKTFRPLNNFMAKDKRFAYYWARRLAGVDAASFEPINAYYFKDVHHIYFIYELPERENFFSIVKDADPKSFRINKKKGPAFGKDNKHEFYYGGTVVQE